jgi:hypothetical protein
MERISGGLIILFFIGLVLTSGCTERKIPNVFASPATPPKPNPTFVPTNPGASVNVSGLNGSWVVEVTNLGKIPTNYVVTLAYLDKNVFILTESKETPIIAPNEKGRVTFFNDSMGEYPVMVQRIKIKNGGYVEFTTTG